MNALHEARPGIPCATYRLQFNRDFTFRDAIALLPYLHDLGISHCYASPYLRARAGSTHGYDIVDHGALNSEIGGRENFEDFVRALQDAGMGHILDIVPNHMGIGGDDNAWWLDVLENGEASAYAQFFDIDWDPSKEELRGKVLCPMLGDHYGAVLENGQLTLRFDTRTGGFSVYYYEHRFPIDPMTYPVLLGDRLQALESRLGKAAPQLLEFQSLISAFGHLPMKRETAPAKREERSRDKELLKQRLADLCARCPDIADHLAATIARFNGEAGRPASFDALHALLEQQAYRLAYWQVASDEINYRRFFDINALAGLRTERLAVFRATHRLVRELVGEGKLQGLRIDHPDGLYDPLRYYRHLQEEIAASGPQELYLVVEKILASHEYLREDWPVHGTTGYEFANLVGGLLVQPDAERHLSRQYERFLGRKLEFDELLYERKKLIMRVTLTSELGTLATLLNRITESDRRTRDFTYNAGRNALMEVVACFPVYRTYVSDGHATVEDRRYVAWAVAQAKKRSPAADVSIFDLIHELLLVEGEYAQNPMRRSQAVEFAMKFQQYTAPVMAKGLEDTSFYSYNRLVSLNEVGGDPRRFGVTVPAFHHANQERMQRWPHTLLSTSTHDSKRSEDVRARIHVLSEAFREWGVHLGRWSRINRARKREVEGAAAPDRNDEYLLYQTLIGTWPLEDPDDEALAAYRGRIEQYMLKAAREAKVHTSWINPNAEYESAMTHFVHALLAQPARNAFLVDFLPFQRRVARAGLFNSLSQTLFKLAAPGVPDIYQGNEIWDFSLVDPDNRRPVDYARRQALLAELRPLAGLDGQALADGAARLLDTLEDGRAKLWVTWRLLTLRRDRPALFQTGAYQPLPAQGQLADHLCAFARAHPEGAAVVVAPRWVYALLQSHPAPIGRVWRNTWIEAPEGRAAQWRNVITGERIAAEMRDGTSVLSASALLGRFPVAFLVEERD